MQSNKIKTKLTEKEIEILIKLLKKVRLPAPYPVFLALCKSVPMVAVDLALMPDKNRVLLTYRKDEFFDGDHIPGCVLCYNEKPEDALKRVASEELGIRIKEPRFLNYFVEFDGREQAIVLLFSAKPKQNPKVGKYFPINKLPKNLLASQKREFQYLKKLH